MADRHHPFSHAVAGLFHTASGLAAGQVLRATASSTFAWQSLVAGDLPTHDNTSHTDRSRYLWFPAPVLSIDGSSRVVRNVQPDGIDVIRLADGATQGFFFTFLVPADWPSGSFNAVLIYAQVTTAAGNFRLQHNRTQLSDADIITEASSTLSQTVAANGTADIITFLSVSGVTPSAAGDLIRWHLRRLGADAADTAASDMDVLGLRLQYTADM